MSYRPCLNASLLQNIDGYNNTFKLRHPRLAPSEDYDASFLAKLQKFELPAYGVDLSPSDLYRLILPPDIDPIPLPYQPYNVICNYMENRSRVPTAPDVAALHKSEIDTLF